MLTPVSGLHILCEEFRRGDLNQVTGKYAEDGFSGLAVSTLASGTRVRGFKPGRSRRIFRASEKSSACLPSEGKWKNLSHVPALRNVKEPSTSVNYKCVSRIPCIVPSFASRGLLCLCGAWRLWSRMRGTHWGQGYNRPTYCSAEKAPHATFTFTLLRMLNITDCGTDIKWDVFSTLTEHCCL